MPVKDWPWPGIETLETLMEQARRADAAAVPEISGELISAWANKLRMWSPAILASADASDDDDDGEESALITMLASMRSFAASFGFRTLREHQCC